MRPTAEGEWSTTASADPTPGDQAVTQIELLDAYDAEIQEGTAHSGKSALIDLVARKRG